MDGIYATPYRQLLIAHTHTHTSCEHTDAHLNLNSRQNAQTYGWMDPVWCVSSFHFCKFVTKYIALITFETDLLPFHSFVSLRLFSFSANFSFHFVYSSSAQNQINMNWCFVYRASVYVFKNNSRHNIKLWKMDFRKRRWKMTTATTTPRK